MTESVNRYEIRTIADIAALRPEQRAGFLTDLRAWLTSIDAMRDFVESIGVDGVRPDTSLMIWCDDGKWGAISGVNFSVRNGEGA